jgi:hypothetical protein
MAGIWEGKRSLDINPTFPILSLSLGFRTRRVLLILDTNRTRELRTFEMPICHLKTDQRH